MSISMASLLLGLGRCTECPPCFTQDQFRDGTICAAVADAGFAVAATADGGLLTVKGCFLKFPGAAARALGHE